MWISGGGGEGEGAFPRRPIVLENILTCIKWWHVRIVGSKTWVKLKASSTPACTGDHHRRPIT